MDEQLGNPEEAPPGRGVNGSGDLAAVEHAAALDGNGLPWDAPSRFGVPGAVARAGLRRALKPYALRQRQLDQAIVAALRDQAGSVEELERQVRDVSDAARDASAGLGTAVAGTNELTARVDRLAELVVGLGHRMETLEAAIDLPDAGILDGEAMMELDTLAGILWYHKDDPLIAPAVKRHGMWEPDISSLLPKVLRPGGTFVDVGANIGYFPVMAAKLVGSTGHIFAVEPEPRNVRLLHGNLWRNDVRNCTVLPVAALDRSGHVRMAVNDDMRAAWVVPDLDTGFLVPCARLDDLLGARPVDVIKIDAEGVDHLVVRGAEGIIAGNPDILLVVEFLPRLKELHGETPAEILDYYQSLGLELFLLSSYGDLLPATPADVLARADDIDVINLALRAA